MDTMIPEIKGRDDIKELAEHIYDLDAEVYAALGSLLGRVYNSDRAHCVEEITELLLDHTRSNLMRSELALIANMARTIKDRDERRLCMIEYNNILQQVMDLPSSFDKGDIIDPKVSGLNELNSRKHFSSSGHLIICIDWMSASGGVEIGFKLADRLKINFYDEKVFEAVRKRLDANQDRLWDPYSLDPAVAASPVSAFLPEKRMTLKRRVRQFSRYHGLTKQDAVFFNQSDLLCHLATMEDFVVMGRCAGIVMENNDTPHISLFITAPKEMRIRRAMEFNNGLDRKKAGLLINRLDHNRASYCRFYTSRKWGDANNYDFCINSAVYGIDGTVDFICRLLQNGHVISA